MINPCNNINVEIKGYYGSALDKISRDLKMDFIWDESINFGGSLANDFKDDFLKLMKLRYKQKKPPIKINFTYEYDEAYDFLVVFFDDIIKQLTLDGIRDVLQVEFIKKKHLKHKKIKYNYL